MSDAAASLYVDSQEMRWVDGVLCQGKSDLFFAPFAERPEVLAWIEAPTNRVPVRTDPTPLVTGIVSLRTILNHRELILTSQCENRI